MNSLNVPHIRCCKMQSRQLVGLIASEIDYGGSVPQDMRQSVPVPAGVMTHGVSAMATKEERWSFDVALSFASYPTTDRRAISSRYYRAGGAFQS